MILLYKKTLIIYIFKGLCNSAAGKNSGAFLITAYNLYSSEAVAPHWAHIPVGFQLLSQQDVKKMQLPKEYSFGFSYLTVIADMRYYLNYLENECKNNNVIFINREVKSFGEEALLGKWDIIINCAGLESRNIVEESFLHVENNNVIANNTVLSDLDNTYPIRGQILRVQAPWIKHTMTFDDHYYVIPQKDYVILGGTAQIGDWNEEISNEDTENIMSELCEVVPSLVEATIEEVWVGLRPGRTSVRLETEQVPYCSVCCVSGTQPCSADSHNVRSIHVMHCYGHGGAGLTLSMGCAEDVCDKLRPLLQNLGLPFS
jgi:D-amino-acid oxidase